jgi:protein PhnA
MSVEDKLVQRANGCCELCGSADNLSVYTVEPGNSTKPEENVLTCSTCLEQIEGSSEMDPNHWRCLNESMWSEVTAVQVLSWRMLQRLRSNDWASDLLDMLYLDDETLQWAKATGEDREKEEGVMHIDSNGAVLENGDTVVLIKDLDVKGAGFTAKRGTAVRNIRLVQDNPEQIEGKINGQGIVILTQYVKK